MYTQTTGSALAGGGGGCCLPGCQCLPACLLAGRLRLPVTYLVVRACLRQLTLATPTIIGGPGFGGTRKETAKSRPSVEPATRPGADSHSPVQGKVCLARQSTWHWRGWSVREHARAVLRVARQQKAVDLRLVGDYSCSSNRLGEKGARGKSRKGWGEQERGVYGGCEFQRQKVPTDNDPGDTTTMNHNITTAS